MPSLQIFNFHGDAYEVRFVGTEANPEWVAADVCKALNIQNPSVSMQNFDEDEKGYKTVYTPGGPQKFLTVTEVGLYRLTFQSRKPQAKAFGRWLLHEVVPSIRKTGSYSVTPQPQPQLELTGIAKQEKTIEIVDKASALLARLGLLDERTAMALADKIKSAVLEDSSFLEDRLALPSAKPTDRLMISVSDRIWAIYGMSLNKVQLNLVGRMMASQYRLINEGAEPLVREQFVDGSAQEVKCYCRKDWEDFGDSVLHIYLMKRGLISG